MGRMGKARFQVLKSETNRHISRLIWCPFEHGKGCESFIFFAFQLQMYNIAGSVIFKFPTSGTFSPCLYKGHSSLAASTSKRSTWLLCLCCFAFWAFSLYSVLMLRQLLPYILMVIKHVLPSLISLVSLSFFFLVILLGSVVTTSATCYGLNLERYCVIMPSTNRLCSWITTSMAQTLDLTYLCIELHVFVSKPTFLLSLLSLCDVLFVSFFNCLNFWHSAGLVIVGISSSSGSAFMPRKELIYYYPVSCSFLIICKTNTMESWVEIKNKLYIIDNSSNIRDLARSNSMKQIISLETNSLVYTLTKRCFCKMQQIKVLVIIIIIIINFFYN